ncbi:MAG: aminoacyl-tRNA hydrolase [Acidimicrobiales bacterium]
MVGLGNPGIEYVSTRHNVGAEVVAALAERHQVRLKSEKGLHAQACDVLVGGRRVLLAVPQTFMNESGLALAALVRRSGIDQHEQAGPLDGPDGPSLSVRLVIVHDELDLPTGRIKIKAGGGNAGHNGLKSIESHLHTNGYLRVRVGIGKPTGRQSGADYVLKRPGAAERAVLDAAVEEGADAVEAILTEGVDAAMNRINASA